MTSWVLVPSLESLRAEINSIAPNRDKSSDGTIGDPAHAGRSSDHNPDETGTTPDEDSDSKNEVHGLDVDKDLKLSGVTMQMVVDSIVAECRKSGSSGLDKGRLKYVIFNGKWWEAPDWNKKDYTGDNPHDQHAHFSAEYDSKYSEDTSPWGLIAKFGDVVTPEDIEKIAAKAAEKTWAYLIADANDTDGDQRKLSAATWLGWSDSRHVTTRNSVTGEVGKKIDAQTQQLLAGQAHLDQKVGQWVHALSEATAVDEETISASVAARVLSVLTPASIVGAIPADTAREVFHLLVEQFQQGSGEEEGAQS